MRPDRTRAAVLPADPAAFVPAVGRAAAAGFRQVEVAALVARPGEHLEALSETGLFVACASLGPGMGAVDIEARRLLLERQKRQVTDAARLGATLVYLTPPAGAGADVLACFTEGCEMLAAFAAGRMVRLAVLPAPGTCLWGVEKALEWLEEVEGVCLGLAAASAEEVRRAGERLAYVRLERPAAVDVAGYRGIVAVSGW
jgi:sugar phosphate isomerase/epimerase